MEIIILNNEKWNNYGDITLTIGNFDGVHNGHKVLLNKVLEYNDYKKAVMTLDPHPSVLFDIKDFYTLFNTDEKIDLINEFDFDYLFIANFNKDFASLSIEEFINKLKELGVKRLVLGSDYRFATKGSGTVNDLKDHFEVIVFEDIIESNVRISSSYIKMLLKEGNVLEANKLLGYNFFIKGLVEHGNKVGRTLGFPTANIDYKDSFLPSNGVYFVTLEIEGEYLYGVANVGNNPTVNYSRSKKLEVFILDYSKQIYDTLVKVNFIDKIRDEIKFNSVEELVDAIKNDEKETRLLIKKFDL